MSIRFRPLFTLAIDHPYYSEGCRDFDFYAPTNTRNALRKGRLLMRQLDGVLHVVCEVDGSNVPINDMSGQTLYFGLQLNNPYFNNFSEPVIANSDLTPLYMNTIAPDALDAAIGVQQIAGLYTHQPQEAMRPVVLSLADADNHVVNTQTVAASGEGVTFDMRNLLGEVWTMTEEYGGGVIRHRTLFYDQDLRPASVWGIVAIKIDASLYTTPAAFKIHFTPRQETLKYYVVASKFSDTEFDQLQVTDAGFLDQARTEVKFDKVLPAAFTPADVSPSLLGDGSAHIALFQSQTLVARSQRGLRKIHLQRNSDVVIEHLPQPGADRTQAQLIIHLSKS